MKKLFNYITLFAALSATLLTGCKKEDLEFEHEKPQFELKADAILLEVIVPSGTAADEQIYITGEFNGGDKYLLEKAEKSDKKWGIYLYEDDFVEGKSLKDGFTFVSAKNGKAFDVKGNPQDYTLDVAYGTRTNVWVNRWESYFKQEEDPGEIVPGKYTEIYVTGNIEGSEWDPANPIVMEMVGTDIFRAEITFLNETSYFAISTAKGDWDSFNGARWGANNALLTEGEVLDIVCDGTEQCVTIAAGTYTITVNLVENKIVIGNGDWATGGKPEKPSKYEHLYVTGNIEGSSWDPANPIELKKVGRDLFRAEITFTAETSYFAFATEMGDWDIYNANRWGGASNDFLEEGGVVVLTNEVKEPCVTIAAGTYTITVNMIFHEVVIGEGDWSGRVEPEEEPEPEPEPEPGRIDTVLLTVKDTITTHLYFVKETESMNNIYVYHADKPAFFGAWPGVNWTEWETANFLGQVFYHYEFKAEYGTDYSFIINNNADKQYNAFGINVGAKTDYFFSIQDENVVEMGPTTGQVSIIRRLFGK